jgi:hypothetical protein
LEDCGETILVLRVNRESADCWTELYIFSELLEEVFEGGTFVDLLVGLGGEGGGRVCHIGTIRVFSIFWRICLPSFQL